MSDGDAGPALSVADLGDLNRLLAQALELGPDARATWLQSLGVEHAPLRPTLERLLAQADAPETAAFALSLPPLDAGGSDAAAFAAGQSIGPYTLLRPLGQGGMGAVWLAERTDRELKRTLALKLPLVAAHPLMRQRLARERDILAALVHPNIARLYDAGVSADGHPYLALEYVDGEPIDAWCRTHGPDTRARLGLFLQVAKAVAHAHARLVLHRDLKPGNILVTADGQVRLLDFGIAKLMEDGDTRDTALTQLAGRALTPDYASPEQIAGRPLGVASDIYTLGVVLCELLTGKRPYRLQRDSRGALEDAIVSLEPALPSSLVDDLRLRRRLAGDIDTIVAKALKKDPAERYETVNAFADDVERHLQGAAVLARPDSRWYRTRRFVARNKLAAGSATAVLAALGTGLGVALWQAAKAREQAEIARSEARTAQAVQAFVLDIFNANSTEQASPLKAQQTTARELLDRGAQRVAEALNDAPAAKLQVLGTLASLYGADLSLHAESLRLLRQRAALAKSSFGAGSVENAVALTELGDALQAFPAQRTEREAALKEAGTVLDRQGDGAAPERARLATAWARLHLSGDITQAEHAAAEASALYRRLQRPRDLVNALYIAGTAARELDHWQAARDAFAEAARTAEAVPGPPIRTLPYAQLGLAEAQANLLDFDGADISYRRGLDRLRQVQGADSLELAKEEGSFAEFLAGADRPGEAVQLARSAVATVARRFPDGDGYFTPYVLGPLAVSLLAHGRPDLADDAATRALAVSERFRPGRPYSSSLREYRADTLLLRGRTDAARAEIERALQIRSAAGARNDESPIVSLHVRSALADALDGRRAEARRLIDEAMAQEPLRAERAVTVDLLLLVAEAAWRNGDGGLAIDACRRVRALIERLRIGSHARLPLAAADAIEGQVLLAQGAAAEARQRLSAALAVRTRLLDGASPQLAQTGVALARALAATGQRDEARRQLAAARAVYGPRPELPAADRQALADANAALR